MALIVQKFGGSSLEGPDRLERAARRIAEVYRQGNDVIAVLSARGNTTDALLREAKTISTDIPGRELDLLLSVGEQIAVAHMAIMLQRMGFPVVALTGWQAGIRTDQHFGDARIHHITGGRIRRALADRKIVLVTGFQGISETGEITTLGRGGSDTTAVALAAYLHADGCYIYTDVDGVYTGDPRELTEAHKLDAISYEDMLEMAALGAKVLHDRSVELARSHNLTFEVRSSFMDVPGTIVGPKEARRYCGVAIQRDMPKLNGEPVAKVSVIGAACREPETMTQVLRALTPVQVHQITQKERSITAVVSEAEATETTRILHYLFLS